jgi:glycerate-2-kinase
LPSNVVELLRSGAEGKLPETPNSSITVKNYVIADSRPALEAMKQKALQLGYKPFIITSQQKGETTVVAVNRAFEILNGNYQEYEP